ncbi:MAG: UDP-3-O-(3-hydroxymyristoyl)glucosamine N-acyltransferase [Bacteroidales bacterium]|nr:UDP-3-O-(3-hydroxymyristoyl)glucosamine N-acyltransferase [Bacteroidales bacterium]
MEFTAKQIAQFMQGEIEGDPEVKVSTLCKIEEGKEGALAFLANPKYTHYIYDTLASVVIVNDSLALERQPKATLIRVKDAYSSFASLLEMYNQYRSCRSGVSSLSFVDKTAVLGEDVYLGEFSVVEKGSSIGENSKIYPQVYVGENVHIGKNVTIFAGVKIYHDTVIGDNVIIHSGVVLGADGFGFAPLEDGTFKKIPQIGNVIIEDDVELGANTCVDRSTMGSTVIKKGTKIDNLCQLAHNVKIGQNTVMSAMTGVAGSTSIGDNCFIGGQVGFANSIKVGNRVKVGAKSAVMKNMKDDSAIQGNPAFSSRDFLKSSSVFRHLYELEKRVRELEKECKKEV